MGDFGGFRMPLWYPWGAVAEQIAVITNAGLFDTSHMGFVAIEGPGAYQRLQKCFTRDLSACLDNGREPLTPGNCVFGVFLNEAGDLIDDAVLYQLSQDKYLAVVNAGMSEEVAGHLAAQGSGTDVTVEDLTYRVGKIDFQGPYSARILMYVLQDAAEVLKDMRYFTFKGHFDSRSPLADTFMDDETPVLLSRTGFTGEFGFEIFVARDQVVQVWEKILSAGKDLGIVACGLATRDALRTGAVLPLSHQDIGAWPFINNPWTFVLPFNADRSAFTKRFIGEAVLRRQKDSPHTYPFAGFDLRKVSVADPAVLLSLDGIVTGAVLTCVSDMTIGRHAGRIYSLASPDKPAGFQPKGLCCGYVLTESKLKPGDLVELKDKKRRIKVEIVDDIRPNRTARAPMSAMV